MPRKWSGYKPNPSRKETGIVNHLKKLGIDPNDFGRFVQYNEGPSTIRKFFPKPDGTFWSIGTMANWKKDYQEQVIKPKA